MLVIEPIVENNQLYNDNKQIQKLSEYIAQRNIAAEIEEASSANEALNSTARLIIDLVVEARLYVIYYELHCLTVFQVTVVFL